MGCSPWGRRVGLSDFTLTFHFHALEKERATHSSVLAWRIPGTGQPGGLLSIGSQSQTRLKRLSTHAPTILPLGPFISSGQYQTLKAFSEA